ncbi:unnamed protein product [Rhodiola kirilowii]
MGFENTDIADEGDVAVVSCSICLEAVSDDGERSWAKLLCGHQFHLDCIGSAFNVKGAMQCPNCRKIEKGQWLYANGGCAFPEFNMDDWPHDEDLYDFRYSEMSFGVHWCPFNGFTRHPTSFNEGEFSSNGYHDLLGQHAISMERASVSSGSHPCPYVAYVSPLNPSSSNLGTTVVDRSNFSGPWTGNESPTSYALPSMDAHYHSWDHPSPHFTATSNRSGGVEQTHRSSRPNADVPRAPPFIQPLQVGHSSGARAGSMASSSMIPAYPGSNARARDRVEALQAYYHQRPNTGPSNRSPVVSGSSRRVSHRGLTQVGSVPPPPSPQLNGLYVPSASSSRNYMEAENSMPRIFHTWEREQTQAQTPSFPSNQIEREPTWGTSFHHSSAPDTGVRFNGYRLRRASDRTSSQNRS